jgi:hypothetical protein
MSPIATSSSGAALSMSTVSPNVMIHARTVRGSTVAAANVRGLLAFSMASGNIEMAVISLLIWRFGGLRVQCHMSSRLNGPVEVFNRVKVFCFDDLHRFLTSLPKWH